VWKTTNGGGDWIPVFDDQTFLTVGDIVFDPSDPEIVYVGTGDFNVPGSAHVGDGVYRTNDGGATWTHLGLEDQRIVSKIVIDPTNSQTIYVATMGLPYLRNNDRGLYKSTDGGTNWEQILFISDSTGISDVLIDPTNPQVLYASGWDRIRNNQESLIIGQGARVYKTTDGGANWTDLSALDTGLPQEALCRTGLAMSGSDPNVVFALFVGTDFELEGIYKTTNAGATWTPIPTDPDLTGLSPNALSFGWYFGKMRVNPLDDNDIFLLGVDLWRTLDGGQNWFMATPPWWYFSVHADKHDLVFTSTFNIVLATDGGLYKTDLQAQDWVDIENIPTTQFYRTAFNPHRPDWYYGGAQDNGSTGGNASLFNSWERIFGGDGFQMAFHPTNPNIVYAETQNGGIVYSEDGGEFFDSGDEGIDSDDRRNWDMQYIISKHLPSILYTGTYRVYRSTNGAMPLWEPISPDLTDGIILHPRFHTITSLSESGISPSILYVGTTDGNVSRTVDGGTNWENISAGLPKRYITSVKASDAFEDHVYITHSGYKDNENIPHVHRSTDRGNTWESISDGLPQLAVNDIYILPDHQDSVLIVATDGGVYASIDRGDNWNRLGRNMPMVHVFDLEYNPVKNEIIAATYARSIMTYSVDSLLNEETIVSIDPAPQAAQEKLRIFPSPAQDNITVAFNNVEQGRDFDLVVLDVNGRLVRQQQGQQNGAVELSLDVADLPHGPYMVKVKIRHAIFTGRFIKI
ncbi:MAG: T9SS type A sorting domain-containing protein, partial [Bacteroidota bacterium]